MKTLHRPTEGTLPRPRPVRPPHPARPSRWAGLAALLLAGLAGCAGGAASMTPQQKEAYELRRYCESHPEDITRCLGFLGDH